jgi:hypothetical protein
MKREMDSQALAELKVILEHLSFSSPPPNPNIVESQPANRIGQWRDEYTIQEIADVDFSDVLLRSVKLNELTIRNVRFTNCDLRQASFANSKLENVVFEQSPPDGNLGHVDFQDAHLKATKFSNCDCGGAKFQRSKLGDCSFFGSNLRVTDFENASLVSVTFRNIEVDTRTKFKDLAKIENVTMERYALHCLGPDFGELTEGNRMRMDIADDAILLRSQFGGFWTLLHLTAIVVFLFPYVWFIGRQWTVATFIPGHEASDSMPLWKALVGFIITGGGDWKGTWNVAWLSFLSFVVFAFYNAARIALLWKTKSLEMKEHITGLPVEFSLEAHHGWWILFQLTRIFFWLALLATIANTIHFFSMRVPI